MTKQIRKKKRKKEKQINKKAKKLRPIYIAYKRLTLYIYSLTVKRWEKMFNTHGKEKKKKLG